MRKNRPYFLFDFFFLLIPSKKWRMHRESHSTYFSIVSQKCKMIWTYCCLNENFKNIHFIKNWLKYLEILTCLIFNLWISFKADRSCKSEEPESETDFNFFWKSSSEAGNFWNITLMDDIIHLNHQSINRKI